MSYKTHSKSKRFLEDPKEEKIEIRKEICKNFLNNPNFKVDEDEEWFDLGEEKNLEELKRINQSSPPSICKTSNNKDYKDEKWIPNNNYETSTYAVQIGKLEEENIEFFNCFAKKKSTQEIIQYLISEAHCTGLEDYDGKLYVKGVGGGFVFACDKTNLKIQFEFLLAYISKIEEGLKIITKEDLETLENLFKNEIPSKGDVEVGQ